MRWSQYGRLGWLFALLVFFSACAGVTHPPVADREAVIPLRSVWYQQSPQPATLLVILPGKQSEPADFDRHDWISRLQATASNLDIVVVDSHYAYYENRSITERLHTDIIVPARQAGYSAIWLLGTSLGGFGSLLYWRDYPESIEGIILFAPYLGPAASAKRIRADGWQAWQPEVGNDFDDLWQWLYRMPADQRQRLWLLYGRFDPFWRQHRLLGDLLSSSQVHAITGGHEWWTGSRLLDGFVDEAPWRVLPASQTPIGQ